MSARPVAISPSPAGPLLVVENLGKVYGETLSRGLLKLLAKGPAAPKAVALKDVSFSLDRGRIHGFIGPDGAGKTTLLRILGGVMPPTSGRVRGRGKVGGLYGFGEIADASKTGRQNVFIQSRLMGWREREVADRVEEIADFAELNRFMDVKVARYSRGMRMRLDFSIVVNLRPDLLLLDDVLAVGDRAFQEKAIARLRALADAGSSVVFVSNDMNHITRLCDSVSVLRSGYIDCDGPPEEVVPKYLRELFAAAGSNLSEAARGDVGQILSVRLLRPDGSAASLLTDDFNPVVEIDYLAVQPTDQIRVGLALYANKQRVLLSEHFFEMAGRTGPMRFKTPIPRDYLSNRIYEMNVSVLPLRGGERVANQKTLKVAPAATFKVLQGRAEEGKVAHRTEVNPLFRREFPWSLHDLQLGSRSPLN